MCVAKHQRWCLEPHNMLTIDERDDFFKRLYYWPATPAKINKSSLQCVVLTVLIIKFLSRILLLSCHTSNYNKYHNITFSLFASRLDFLHFHFCSLKTGFVKSVIPYFYVFWLLYGVMIVNKFAVSLPSNHYTFYFNSVKGVWKINNVVPDHKYDILR